MLQKQTQEQLKQSVISGDIPKFLETTMLCALEEGASDIHIEPHTNAVVVRIRIDGQLAVIIEYPLNMHPSVISKLKLMSNLKIDESRIPQDGRINTWVGEKELDLRLSTLPTPIGEKAVMRVLDKSKKIPELKQLGIVGRNYQRFHDAITQPNGIILTSGPTGSGKTTTMYSALSFLNKPDVNIMTLEDPIENQMDGLNQSQVRPHIGYTFASGLRTALRQDPDIIMVGEIRDKETIDIAIEASLTGHLVLSTIHTNSAIETITRILNMKVPDFLLCASINLIIAQRLVRRLCPHCKQKAVISDETKARFKKAFEHFHPYEGLDMSIFNNMEIYEANPNGCEHCNGRGYKGRAGIYEIMEMTERLKRGIIDGKSSMDLELISRDDGMVTLEQDGLIKALQGITSLEEVYKIVKE